MGLLVLIDGELDADGLVADFDGEPGVGTGNGRGWRRRRRSNRGVLFASGQGEQKRADGEDAGEIPEKGRHGKSGRDE